VRRVPLHPALLSEGILEYVHGIGDGPIFPDVPPDRFGRRAGTFTKRYTRWARDQGVYRRRVKVAYSWRHTMELLLQGLHVPQHVFNAIMGHTSGTMSEHYAKGGGGVPLRARASELQKVPNLLDVDAVSEILDEGGEALVLAGSLA